MQQRAGGLNIKALLLIKEKLISQVKEFSIFLFGKMQESGLTVIMPFICNSAILGQYQDMFFSNPELPWGSTIVLMAVRSQVFFFFLSVFRAQELILEACGL